MKFENVSQLIDLLETNRILDEGGYYWHSGGTTLAKQKGVVSFRRCVDGSSSRPLKQLRINCIDCLDRSESWHRPETVRMT